MGFKCGIVGLPNVGKSTLFNALTKTASAQAANYPFCTIDPNIGRVAVPDKRLHVLSKVAGSAEIIPAQLEFVDIAGLVKGASKGEGLGNQFLSHIREVDAIIHLLRCFEDSDITHTQGSVDPVRDRDIIETELMLADLASIEKQMMNLAKKARQDKEAAKVLEVAERIKTTLEEGKAIREIEFDEDNSKIAKSFFMITAKPILYVCNVDEGSAATGNSFSDLIKKDHPNALVISAEIEKDIALLETEEDKEVFLEDLGLKETGLDQIIHAGYELLNLMTYFTVGPKETHAWTITKGMSAPQSAGKIHTDFEKGFIRAEVIAYNDYVACKGETGAKAQGKMQTVGKDYITRNGDIMHFLFNK
ncbi:MAG: redox-regulated ATPase YchF [Alphaproteobacteria bacterium]|nr:redox-regulated ATPase YchF [Alphaproteobacteria bacterium]MBN2780196.1 redox-regulated ATPase YchF [Alphaproteobacteria bacterium]